MALFRSLNVADWISYSLHPVKAGFYDNFIHAIHSLEKKASIEKKFYYLIGLWANIIVLAGWYGRVHLTEGSATSRLVVNKEASK